MISEALKINSTLIELDLRGDGKQKDKGGKEDDEIK